MIILRRNQQLRPWVRSTRGPFTGKYKRGYFINPNITTRTTSKLIWKLLAGTVAATTIVYLSSTKKAEADTKIDYDAVRKDIKKSLEDHGYDDGSYGPILVRLAWHASGTYDKASGTGGSDGATMRFEPESAHGANAGLQAAREHLEKIKQKYPGITYADLWTLAGVVSIEALGGPKIPWRPGRSDKSGGTHCSPDGRLPDASKGPQHLRDIFYRMGFNDREIVALAGAHALGRCHVNRSGYSGIWTHSPTVFSNDYFEQLLKNKWTKKKWNGPEQFEDPSGKLMMLPADLALIQDPEFLKYVKMYAEDSDLFFKDFAAAFQKLEELGVNFNQKPWWKFW